MDEPTTNTLGVEDYCALDGAAAELNVNNVCDVR